MWSFPEGRTLNKAETGSKPDDKLYRLCVLEEKERGQVKVHYVGYGSEYDEWRAKEDVVVLNNPASSGDEESDDDIPVAKCSFKQICLYDELGYRIKCCLMSDRKRDPLCRVSISFDTLYFDGLAMRGTVVKVAKYYTITKFSSLMTYLDVDGPFED